MQSEKASCVFLGAFSGPRFNDSADSASSLIVIVFCLLCDGVLPDEVSRARPQNERDQAILGIGAALLDPLKLRSGRMSRACERVRTRLRFFARGRSGGAAAARVDLSARAPAAGPRGWSIQADILLAPDGWGALP